MQTRTMRARMHLVVSLLTLALLASACGGDDGEQATEPDASGGSGAAEPGSAASGAVDGCGAEAATDPADRSQSRSFAHCEPGAPAAQPLDEPRTITMSAATKGEYLAPVLLGQALGEFEKENLTVEVVQMPFSDAIGQMASGNIDAANGGPFASFTNGVGSGLNIKWVLANYSPMHGGDVATNQSGLWVRRDFFSDPDDPDICELAGESVANSLGGGTVAVYWLGTAFEEAGCSLSDVTFEAIQPADQLTAMESGAVPAAFMLDPFWTQAAEQSDDYALIAVQPREPNGGIFFGPNLLEDDPEAGAAFVRAYIRTINTYLQPGYKDDDEVINALAEAIPVDAEQLRAGDELAFEWELRAGVMDEAQRWYTELDTQQVEAVPEDELIDRSFYLRAVGAEDDASSP